MSLPWASPSQPHLPSGTSRASCCSRACPASARWVAGPILAAASREVATDGMRALERVGEAWWAGWLSYDLGREIERMPVRARRRPRPSAAGARPLRGLLEWDHERREVQICGDGDASHLLRALARRRARSRAAARAAAPAGRARCRGPRTSSAVRRAIDYIRAGDVFQVNLAQRLGTDWAGDPFALYGRLRRDEPGAVHGARAARRRRRDLGLAGAVPEPPRRSRSRRGPIKGTRPAGDRARARTGARRSRCARAPRTARRT